MLKPSFAIKNKITASRASSVPVYTSNPARNQHTEKNCHFAQKALESWRCFQNAPSVLLGLFFHTSAHSTPVT